MFELIARVVVASAAMAAAGILGQPSFEVTWKTALFFAAYSYLLYMMGQRGIKNPGIAGLAAVVDCGVIAVILADLGQLQTIGALCAAPMVLAYFRDRANAAMMSPLVASWLLIGANLFGGGNSFTPMLLVQALGVLVVGVALSQARVARENKKEKKVAVEATQIPIEAPVATVSTVELEASEYEGFRESFRSLTESARELEKRGRKDRACVQLFEAAARQTSAPFVAVASSIQDLSGAEGVLLHTVSTAAEAAIVRGTAGNVEADLTEASIAIAKGASEQDMIDRSRAAIAESRSDGAKSVFSTIALKMKGKLVGLLTLFHSNSIELEASMRRAVETSDFLAELVADQMTREDERRRLKEAELLYTVATTTLGATTVTALAQRVLRELADAVKCDHLSIWTLEDGSTTLLASEGTDLQVHEHLVFPQGKGLVGWLGSGTPVLNIANARNDARFASQEAVRRRIGSLLLVPLEFGAQPFGFLVATTSKPSGIDLAATETLRAVCAELSQSIARHKSGTRGPEGLATPKEFFETVKSGVEGFLVYLEVLGQSEIADVYGKPAIEHAVRRFAIRLRSELPTGASLTRRNEGDYVVFIPNQDESYVRRWANDATTLASLIGVRTLDGKARIPLAMRAKVAPLNQQNNQFSKVHAA